MKKKLLEAFTLAEVLITLGIIGIVAAMTIPTLIANSNSLKYKAQFKKTVSTLNQAGLMAQSKYNFDYAGTNDYCNPDQTAGASEHPDEIMTFCAIFNGTLTGQTFQGTVGNLKRNVNGKQVNYEIVRPNNFEYTISNNYKDYITYTLSDGSIVAFNPDAQKCELPIGTQLTEDIIDGSGSFSLAHCVGFIDVNGVSLPNREVTCGAGGTGKASNKVESPCIVKNDANHMTDIFPVVFHDSTVEAASDAAKFVLNEMARNNKPIPR